MSSSKLTHDDYTVGWICPLEVEQIAAEEMLDNTHPRLSQPPSDSNSYTLGSIAGHNVVIAGLPTTGNCSTATVVAHMRSTFPKLRFGLLVGIGGGVPTRTDAGDIRLGDVVVSKPTGQHSGAIQYDHGKAQADKFERTGFLAPPPNVLLGAAHQLGVSRARARTDPLFEHLQRIDISRKLLKKYKYPGRDKDQLYQADYVHADRSLPCTKCGCDNKKLEIRAMQDSETDDEKDDAKDEDMVRIHRGIIATGEQAIRNGEQRDALAQGEKVLCFEMEAAGALNDLPCLVIRGISNYSDSHDNYKWHGYAAATAAAYARELFFHIPIDTGGQCQVAAEDTRQVPHDGQFLLQGVRSKRAVAWFNAPGTPTDSSQTRDLRSTGASEWFLASTRISTSGAIEHSELQDAVSGIMCQDEGKA